MESFAKFERSKRQHVAPGYISAGAAARAVNSHGLDFSQEITGLAQSIEEEEERK